MLARKLQQLKLFSAIILLLTVVGCANHAPYPYRPQSMEINLSEPLSGSSSDYLKAAMNQSSPQKENYLLSAAAKLIDEHAFDRAEQIINSVPDNNLPPVLANLKQLLRAHLNLIKGHNQKALNALATIQPEILAHYYRIQFHLLLAHAYENRGSTLQSVEQRIKLNSMLSDPKERIANKEKNME